MLNIQSILDSIEREFALPKELLSDQKPSTHSELSVAIEESLRRGTSVVKMGVNGVEHIPQSEFLKTHLDKE